MDEAQDVQLTIVEAQSEQDFANVRALCEGFLAWLRTRYAHEAWLIDRYYAPEQWQAVLNSLPTVHAPPQGCILLARLDDEPVGCAMMRPLDETTCEMKRLFVRPEVCGHGVGLELCKTLMTVAAETGYRVMRLDIGVHHDEAIGLYHRLGFRFRDACYDCPPDVARFLHFMEAELSSRTTHPDSTPA